MWHDEPERAVAHAEPSAAQERKETGRLEALSDGVFAIAMTLLVLSIPPPKSGATAQATLDQLKLPLITYVISFLTILVMWVNHHYMFQFVARIDRFFVIANGLLLMVIVFVNYPTVLVADSIQVSGQASGAQFAAITYNVTLIISAILYNALWFRIVHRRRLLVSDADDAEVSGYTRQYLLGGPMYVVALALAFVSPGLSIALDAALAIFWAFTGKIIRTQARHPARRQSMETRQLAPQQEPRDAPIDAPPKE